MPDERFLYLLTRGVSVWNLQRKQNPSLFCSVDLSKADLSSINMAIPKGGTYYRADLRQADLTNVNLTGTNLERARLTRADLTGANLTGAILVGTIFRGAKLVGANLTRALFSDTNFEKANLSGAELARVKLTKAVFTDANLTEANLSRTVMAGVKFNRATLARANLSGTDLTRVNLEEAQLTGANLAGANLSHKDLSNRDLSRVDLSRANLKGANIRGADLSHANLSKAKLAGVDVSDAILTAANLSGANLSRADLSKKDLSEINLSGADLVRADLSRANLSKANLFGVDFSEADLAEANLAYADLTRSTLVETVLRSATLTGCRVYGISAWNLNLAGTQQRDLIVTSKDEPIITADDLEVAQFIYLLFKNEKIRNVIDTITSKAVLILGRFTPERKGVLNAIADELRKYNLLPIIFDFERSASRDFTETIKTLASLSLFIIVDITNPKSAPLELQATVPDYQVPFVPIIQEGEEPFSMFRDLPKYPWVLKPVVTYPSIEELLRGFKPAVIERAWEKHQELQKQKTETTAVRSVNDFVESSGIG